LYGDTLGANRSDCRGGVRGSFDRFDSRNTLLGFPFLGSGVELAIHLSKGVVELRDRHSRQGDGDR
jgi:hypothetical protein